MWASIGLGALASACCWVPLVLAGLGMASGTLGAKIAWIRPWALGGLLILLLGLLGWWAHTRFASARTAKDCCAVVPKFPTLAVTILMVSFVFAWASPRLLHRGRNSTLTALATPAPAGGTLLVISTPQFDCPPLRRHSSADHGENSGRGLGPDGLRQARDPHRLPTGGEDRCDPGPVEEGSGL